MVAIKRQAACNARHMQSAKANRITHSFCFGADPALVYMALTQQRHIQQWWSADSIAEDFVGGQLKLGRVPHDCLLVVERLESGKTVEWKCTHAPRHCSPSDECVGTMVRFHLARNDQGGTQVEIHHRGWRNRSACLEAWNQRWATLAGKSLKSYVETGRGQPVS